MKRYLSLSINKYGIINLSETILPSVRPKEIQLNDREYELHTGKLIIHKTYDYEYALKKTKNQIRSINRTRKTIVDLCDLNPFKYFLTVTFNKDYVDRENSKEVHQKFKNIIKRFKYQFNGCEYLQVAEYHKDEKSIHYHMFANFGIDLKLKYKGKTKKGVNYYTIQEDFKKEDCFITVEKIEGKAPSDYLIKYLTKSGYYPLTRKYGCSRSLKRPTKELLYRVVFNEERSTEISEKLQKTLQLYYQVEGMCKSPIAEVRRYHKPRLRGLDLSKGNVKDENLYANLRTFLKIAKLYGSIYGFKSLQTPDNIRNYV